MKKIAQGFTKSEALDGYFTLRPALSSHIFYKPKKLTTTVKHVIKTC